MVDRHCGLSPFVQLSRGRLHSRHAQQVVGGADEVSRQLRFSDTDKPSLSHASYRLDPAEDLFDPLSLALANGITLMSGGPSIESGSTAPLDLSNVGSDLSVSQLGDEGPVVVTLVGAPRAHLVAALPAPIEHGGGCLGFRQRRVGDRHIDQKTFRFSISACAPKLSLAGCPLPSLMSLACGSVLDSWV